MGNTVCEGMFRPFISTEESHAISPALYREVGYVHRVAIRIFVCKGFSSVISNSL